MTELEQILLNLEEDFDVDSIVDALKEEDIDVADESIPYLAEGWDYIRSSHGDIYGNMSSMWDNFVRNARDIIAAATPLRARRKMSKEDLAALRAELGDPHRADCLLTAAWWLLSRGGTVKRYAWLSMQLPGGGVTEMTIHGDNCASPREVPADECFNGCTHDMRRAFAKFPYYLDMTMGFIWNTLQEEGYVDENYKLDRDCCSRAEARRIVEGFYKIAHKKGAGNKRVDWEPFEAFWAIRNLARARKLDTECDKAKKIAHIFS